MDADAFIKDQKLQMRKKAMDLLARREHSFLELCRKLQQRYSDPDTRRWVEDVVQQLADDGLQSDARFAESYLNMRVSAGFGPQRIQLELRERGVDDALVRSLFEACEQDWFARGCEVYGKKFGYQAVTDHRDLAKRQRFLHYRGFAADLIHKIIQESH